MTRHRLLAAVGVLALATNVAAQSKDDPSIGTWRLNVAKSKFTSGPPIKGDTRSYEVNDEGWLIVQTETTQPDGRRTGVRFAAKLDGKAYPQIGRFAPTVTLITYESVDKLTLKYTQRDTSGKNHAPHVGGNGLSDGRRGERPAARAEYRDSRHAQQPRPAASIAHRGVQAAWELGVGSWELTRTRVSSVIP